MFVRNGPNRLVNLRLAREVYRHRAGEGWFATFDGDHRPVSVGFLNDARIDDLTATIVPASPDEILHLLIGWPDGIAHEQYRVIAWALEPGMPPRPITPVGTFPEYDAETTTLVHHPDGRFEELYVGDSYASLDAAKDELFRRMVEREERKLRRASLVDAGPEVAA